MTGGAAGKGLKLSAYDMKKMNQVVRLYVHDFR